MKNEDVLVQALIKEIALQKDYLNNEAIETIYFGGGTPSVLTTKNIAKILDTIHVNFDTSSLVETTLEGNPDDLTKPKLQELRQLGINRLSIGNQSFDANILTYLNRSHTSSQSIASIMDAKEVGFDNINVDLIYGIPHESYSLKSDLKILKSLDIQHVSAYALTIEKKTVFGTWLETGKMIAKEDEFVNQDFQLLINELQNIGIVQYEISNFAKGDYYSKHNTSYWQRKKYLGIGPSAHSFNGMSRQYNVSNNVSYINHIHLNTPLFEREILTKENKINEYMMTGLRTKWGIDLSYLKNDFNFDLVNTYEALTDELIRSNMILIEDEILFLTKTGKSFADKIASDFFLC